MYTQKRPRVERVSFGVAEAHKDEKIEPAAVESHFGGDCAAGILGHQCPQRGMWGNGRLTGGDGVVSVGRF